MDSSMKNIRFIVQPFVFILATLLLTGCAGVGLKKNFMSSAPKNNGFISEPKIFIEKFDYKPAGSLDQKTISLLGCIKCEQDGSTPAMMLQNNVAEIIRFETIKAMEHIGIHNDKKNQCYLNGTVHLAGWNNINGDSYIDITFRLGKEKQKFYEKRLKGHYDAWIFEVHRINQLFSKAVSDVATKLLKDKDFSLILNKYCTSKVM